MKKVLTLCLFMFAMAIGTQSVEAQVSKVEINGYASEKVEALNQELKFTDDQREEVYQVFQAYIKKKMNLEKSTEASKKEELSKLEMFLDNKLKLIFTDEQYSRYTELEN